jgi:hypothetical protein
MKKLALRLTVLALSVCAHGAPALVLVELFTSQGCSSCPPADALLAKLDEVPHVVVLSEHVDYWNYLGWRDPFSSAVFSERQAAYVRRFGLRSAYTPQMVVDGQVEFVGSDGGQARRAIDRAGRASKLPITITRDGNTIRVDASAGAKAELWIALAREQGASDVPRGENAGRHLKHVAVVRSLFKAGEVGKDKALNHAFKLPPPEAGALGWRVVAFLQEPGPGRVVGVAKL